MDETPHQITLTALFWAVSLCCVTVGICVAWPDGALLVGPLGVAMVGGLLLSAWTGFLAAMATVLVVVAVHRSEALLTPVDAVIMVWTLCCLPLALFAYGGKRMGQWLSPRKPPMDENCTTNGRRRKEKEDARSLRMLLIAAAIVLTFPIWGTLALYAFHVWMYW